MTYQRDSVVIGIDGGGTHTRVMVADVSGQVLAYVEKAGASSIYKDLQAQQNVQEAILEALRIAGKSVGQVAALTAGIAGLDDESDYEWVVPLTRIDGLDGLQTHVNDAVVAHSGALLAQPGIIVISGTGSIIYAVTEEGQRIRNYDLTHYAASSARAIAYDAVFELLAGEAGDSDRELADKLLQFWDTSSTAELSKLAMRGFVPDERERNRLFAQLAPIVTEAAASGSHLARRVCDRAIGQIKVGIELLAAYFDEPEVEVALIGSVVNSAYFEQQLQLLLADGRNRKYRCTKPALTPAAGAVLLALKQLNVPIDEGIVTRLRSEEQARFC